MQKKLVIIDGNAIMHRAFHAIPLLTNKKGNPTNAIYGLTSMLLSLIDTLKPTHLTVCFDEKKPTFRHKKFKKYQSHRPPTHKDLVNQFEMARDFLKAANIQTYSKAGYEADDLIGTLSQKTKGFEKIIIVTGDRDILQLVNEKVNLYMPISGMSNGKLFGIEETKQRLGIPPNKIIYYKALVGDPSDNYKGVPGIGPKTAISLIEKYKDLKGIYGNLDKIPEKVREKLTKDKKNAFLSLELATIVCNVPFKYNLEKMDDWKLDSPKVLSLFEEFGFKTLTQRIKKVGKKLEEEKQQVLF